MYKILVRETYQGNEEAINEPDVYGNRIVSGSLSLVSGGIDTGTLTISLENTLFNRILPYRWFIRIEDLQTKKTIFQGRFIKVSKVYSTTHTQTLSFESELAYLHDSAQVYREIHNTSVNDFLKIIIDEHNRQVDDFKKIILGTINVTNSTDNVYRYLDETKDTLDNITDNLVNRLGGFLRIGRNPNGQLILDYVKHLGTDTNQTIELGVNLKSFTRNLNVNNLITRLVPLGAEKAHKDDQRDSNKPIPKIDISSVNNGSRYLDDPKLIDKFGIIENVNIWDDVHDAGILKKKGEQYLKKQLSAEITWSVDIVNLALIDKRFQSFAVGNNYRIIDKFMDIDETISVSEKEVDLVNPQTVTIKIGNQNKNLTSQQINQSRIINQLKNFSEYITSFNTQNNVPDTPDESHQDQPQDQPSHYNGGIFIDLSSNNGSMSVSDFTSLYNAGVRGLIDKLTESTDYTNSLFDSQIANASSAGIKTIGTYHYYKGGGASEAQYYLSQLQAKNIDKSLIVACDVEDSSLSTNKSELNAELIAFFNVLTNAGYANTCLYGPSSWFDVRFSSNLAKYTWKAAWGSDKPSSCSAWQYTDKFNELSLDASKSYDKAFI